MSSLLWKYYHDEEVDRFRHLLSNGSTNQYSASKSHGGNTAAGLNLGSSLGSPVGFGTSAKNVMKNRPTGRQGSATKGGNVAVTKADVNSRDYAGLTILHRAASSTSELAMSFATALLEHPAIDLHVQDLENGWTALHRALYFGNVTMARAIIDRDSHGHNSHNAPAQRSTSSIIKVKDHEGNSPFDVYNATIARRSLQRSDFAASADDVESDADIDLMDESPTLATLRLNSSVDGEEVWSWGSNRNFGLGFKDEDDRQHPEKIFLSRPDHLLFRFYREHILAVQAQPGFSFIDSSRPIPKSVKELPTLITSRPIIIQDVVLSKLHSAILTTDPESNLYICGFGPGGRLGLGNETTRFGYTCVEEGSLAEKKVTSVALGQNHTLALTAEGEVSAWGTNTYGQLGYNLPRPALQDEEPVCATPRQIFGALKRERIVGIAASAIHSVAFTPTSLYTWGKNEGQLGLMDSDSRSLDFQSSPRKVAASLFKSPIVMASAINRATVVLLANHTVCAFTSYGYNIIKFPLQESFTNYHLKSSVLTTSYDSIANHVSSITAGGDTIAAITSRGDLFTVNLKKVDSSSNASTTNPTKIKDSLSLPERVWSLRKGNWDGVKSASVAENGSVIICTHAGAVWRRVKRAKNKDAFVGHGYSKKDYKFQRVPGLTKVAAVRSTPFGAYAAIRKDCDVTRSQITVDAQRLWQDVAPLLSLSDLEPLSQDPKAGSIVTELDARDHLVDKLKQFVLKSPDPEEEIRRFLDRQSFDGFEFEIGTTTSDVAIPIHSFIAGRSPVLRAALRDYQRNGHADIADVLTIKSKKQKQSMSTRSLFGGPPSTSLAVSSTTAPDLATIVVHGCDFLTILNVVIYLYCDTILDVWHFTRDAPSMAHRFRQIRVELMKLANHFRLLRLESAARLMVEPEPQLNLDMGLALQDPNYLETGDIIIELEDEEEFMVHSVIMCQRCPFFEGMFNGRAGGRWLDSRRGGTEDMLRIDLKHFSLETFNLVVRYIYSDAGTELFDEVVSADIDTFSEVVLDVMAAANELMLDRLSQICQEVIGRFVNTRNISQLLNVIAPCSVTEFKDAGLEYVCLQLEAMLENELLGELDDDLLSELDDVVRANQLNCLPFAKSGRAEMLLHEQYPELAEEMSEERQRRIRDMAFRANMHSDDPRSLAYRTRLGSVDDSLSTSPSQEKSRRKSKAATSLRNAPFSPDLKPKNSAIDLMFDMDEDAAKLASPDSRVPELDVPTLDQDVMGKSIPENGLLGLSAGESPSSLPHTTDVLLDKTPDRPKPTAKMWSSPALPSTKLDMKEIMSQASNSRTSALSLGLSAQKAQENVPKPTPPKMSQKERKKQQQAQQATSSPKLNAQKGGDKPASPWQIASRGPTTSLKDVLQEPSPLQTVPLKALGSPLQSVSSTPRRTASPDTRFAGQRRTASGNNVKSPAITPQRTASPDTRVAGQRRAVSGNNVSQVGTNVTRPVIVTPHSKSYNAPTPRAEPTLQLSMSDIIGQQQRELEVMKEAVAKRSLQEIQEEQAFQEWWDAESRRAQEEEAARSRSTANIPSKGAKGGNARGRSGRGRGRGRGDAGQNSGRGRGRGQEQAVEQS